jgi:hypothetical protein
MLGIIGDLMYAFLIHLILVIIIFFIEGERRKCLYEHYLDRKKIIQELSKRAKHWHMISLTDTNMIEKDFHHRLAAEYLDVLNKIMNDEGINIYSNKL